MKTVNFIFLAALFVLIAILYLWARKLWRRAPDSAPFKAALEGSPQAKWLCVPLAFVGAMALLACWVLLFIAFVCFFYAAGLGYGELAEPLGAFELTAGKILFVTTFPAQMFVMGLFVLLIVLGGFQIVLGPLPLSRFGWLKIDGVRPFVRRLAGLLAVVAGLELTRTVVVGLIATPEGFLEFFARQGRTPLMDPTGLALLAVLIVFAALAIILRYGNRS